MSIERPYEVKCPDCGTANTVIIHDSINVTIDPEKKPMVLDRSIFKFHCKKCGMETELSYCPLYHDMREKYMIWVVPDKESAYNGKIPDIGLETDLKFSLLANGYRLRIVCGINGLIEKIKIFDSKLDDHSIEMVKMMIFSKLKQPEEILFCDADEEKINFFVIYDDSQKNTGISVDRENYDIAAEILTDERIDKEEMQYVAMETIGQFLNDKSKGKRFVKKFLDGVRKLFRSWSGKC